MTPEQDRLVTDHLNLVGYALRSMPATRAYHDQDGLQGAGNLGLTQAAAAYQPHVGLQLTAADDPTTPHDTAETAAILAAGIAQLRPSTQLVIDAVFFAGQRQCELAEALGVTDARVSQMLAEAVRKLRATVLPALTGQAA